MTSTDTGAKVAVAVAVVVAVAVAVAAHPSEDSSPSAVGTFSSPAPSQTGTQQSRVSKTGRDL